MTSERDVHPDEGTIHAWLDRQLDDAGAARLEAHLQGCDECAERVAEARGFIAGASRVVASLDDAGATGAGPASAGAPVARLWGPAILPTTRVLAWRTFRLTPARSAIAAVLVVAVATAIVHENQRPSSRLAKVAAEREAASAPAVAALPSPAAAGLDSTAAARVATARTAARAQRETTVNADLARVGRVPAPQASTPVGEAAAAARAAERSAPPLPAGEQRPQAVSVQADRGVAGGVARGVAQRPFAGGVEVPFCYRVESASGAAASWGPVPLPFTLALDAPATRESARVLGAEGQDAGVRAKFERHGDDSLVFTLQRTGYSGTLTVGAPGEIRAGVMRSVAVSAPAPERDAAPAVPVVLRKVKCSE